jgi:DNA polymerase III subunit gamma/tau
MRENLITLSSDTNRPFHSKYRPNYLDDIIGQEHIVSYFKNVILSRRISFAYLFIGKHGLGKTTMSRIIAKALNCRQSHDISSYDACDKCVNCINITSGKSFDIHEINAALNTGIDSIRDLIEKIQFSSVNSSYKICIIDEAHMLSLNAFNALLKVLEAPPKNVVFILATTEIKRIPNTINSRCQKLFFLPLSKINLASSISNIVWIEGGHITNKALLQIVTSSKGSLRDALNAIDMFMTNDINITESSCSFLSTEIPCSVSKLFFSYLVSGNIISILQVSDYIQSKKWLEDSLINQIQTMLEYEIINSHSSSFKSEYLVCIWQLLLKYHSHNFSNIVFSSFLFELINIPLRSHTFKESNSLVGKKKIPSFIKMKNIYIS